MSVQVDVAVERCLDAIVMLTSQGLDRTVSQWNQPRRYTEMIRWSQSIFRVIRWCVLFSFVKLCILPWAVKVNIQIAVVSYNSQCIRNRNEFGGCISGNFLSHQQPECGIEQYEVELVIFFSYPNKQRCVLTQFLRIEPEWKETWTAPSTLREERDLSEFIMWLWIMHCK